MEAIQIGARRINTDKSASGYNPSRSGGRIRLQTDVIVDRIAQSLLTPKVSLSRLNGDMTEQELNLFQLASGLMAKPCTGPSQIMRCYGWQTAALGPCFYNRPDHFGRKAVSPYPARLVDGAEQWACVDVGTECPIVDRLLYPLRNRNCSDVPTFSSQVCNDPMALAKLEILQA